MNSIFWMVIQVVTIVAVMPFFDGIARIVRARMQSRKGPNSVFQTYYDIFKLLKRGGKTTPKYSHWFFRYAPFMLFAANAAILAALPITYSDNINAGAYADIFVIIYLGALARFIFGVASMDSGSPFAAIGGSREQMLAVFVEPVAIICLIVVMLLAKTSNLVVIQNLVREGVVGYQIPAFAVASIAFLWASYVETGRNPYDLAEAEQEVLEGVAGEYSGSDLAIVDVALMIKQVAMIGLFLSIFEPWNFTNPLLALFIFIIEIGIFYVGATFIDNLGPRYKLLKGFKKNASFAFSVAFVALILYVVGV
jgi:formate hydrogenlyase subunit 4